MKAPLLLPLLCSTLLAQAAPQSATNLPDKSAMSQQVREQFLHAWDGYRRYAWAHDELRPLSNKPFDWYGSSLLMTPVDALDTMILMDLNKEADEDRHLVDTQLSFDKDIYVKNFEITIRLLGGLLSSYELTGDQRLLALAQDLGNRLLPAYHSPTGMPYVLVNLRTGAVRGEETNPAEVGTLLLELGTLSKLTGNPVYYQKAKAALVAVYDRRSPIGLVGDAINVRTGKWTSFNANINGGSDSYYEYLLKAWKLFGDEDCHRMWLASVAALNKYVAQETSTGLWYGEANMNTGSRTGTEYGALAAFFAGSLALSGDLDRARRLQDSNYKLWNLTGIEPEMIDYSSMKILTAGSVGVDIIAPSSIEILSSGYELRPENIESAYYLYYFTHDPRYRRMGLTYFNSIVKYCRTPVAFASLSSVESKEQRDDMESYFFAETMKYLYLLLGKTDRVDLSKTAFNTEAHPLNIVPYNPAADH